MRNAAVIILLTLVTTIPAWSAVPQYGGTAASMVIDPISENWYCGTGPGGSTSLVPSSRCYNGSVQGMEAGAPVNGSTYWLEGLASHAGVITWAVQGGGFYNGPGSAYTNGGDNFVIFQSPDTHDGRRGQFNTMTLMNDIVRPDDGGFWHVGSFAHYGLTASYELVAWASYPTGNQNTITDTVIWLGSSASGYHNYSWRDLVTFKQTPNNRGGSNDYGIRVVNVSTVPDPSNSQRWIGTWSWTEQDGPGGWGDGARGTAPAMIDFSQAGVPGTGIRLCLGFENLDLSPAPGDRFDYYCYNEGDVIDQRPVDPLTGAAARPARAISSHLRSFSLVNTSTGGFHAELWWNIEGTQQGPLWCDDPSNRTLLGYGNGPNPIFGGFYTAQENCSLDRNFCGAYLTDPSQYLQNRDLLLGGKPDFLRYREWSLSTSWITGSNFHLDNDLTGLNGSMRGWPSITGDHARTYASSTRHDWSESGKEALYVTVKRGHCVEPYHFGNDKFHGLGIAHVNMVEK